MTEFGMAMDPVTARVAWTRQMEYHLGMIPQLLRTALGLAVVLGTPHIPVSRGGSQFDRPQITGGGYYDSAPTLLGLGNERAAGDATYLWSLLADYAESVSEWLGADTRIPRDCPNTATGAYDASLLIVGTLLQHSAAVWEHRELDSFEREMFAEIRRQQRGYLPAHDGQPQHARTCLTCGSERSVRVIWVDGLSGSPKPRQIGSCRVCGEKYEPKEGET